MADKMNTSLNLKCKQQEIHSNYLNEINLSLFQAKQKNHGRTPHKMIYNIIQNSKTTFP